MALLDRLDQWIEKKTTDWQIRRLQKLCAAIQHECLLTPPHTAGDILKASSELKSQIEKGRKDSLVIFDAIKLASLASKRFLGYVPNQTQIAAGIILSGGNIIEMKTGEGKTTVALLTSYLQILYNRHVDIATTNDYLAERDQHSMGVLFGVLGSQVGLVLSGTPREKRKEEYAKGITYVANQELGFDYLNDNLALSPEEQITGKRDFVLIDEVDSILLDEARTALIITEPDAEGNRGMQVRTGEMRRMLNLAKKLEIERDYIVDYRMKTVTLTDTGTEKVRELLGRDPYAAGDLHSLRALWYALYARIFLKTDRDFMVKDGKVVLVDEFTGHALPDRVLFEGLQEAAEAMVGANPSGDFRVTASATYRSFFRLYSKIAGMSGTAFGARDEFFKLYGLKVLPFRPHQGSLRYDWPTTFFRASQDKIAAAAGEAQKAVKDHAPLLIVGRSIESVKELSSALEKEHIPHQLLHAAVGTSETEIIRQAGDPGAITVATNMAGRGTDIVIDKATKEKTGLRVLGFEHNMSKRIDDQLRGRAGRQGNFGETKMFASLEDELLQTYGDESFWNQAEKKEWGPEGIADPALLHGLERAQARAERADTDARMSLARFEDVVDLHRHAAYQMRQEILTALPEKYLEDLFSKIHHILRREHASRIELAEIEKLFRTPETDSAKPVNAVLIELMNGNIKEAAAAVPPKAEKEFDAKKRNILQLLDQVWQRYLESINWLESWISLVSFANENPVISFTDIADQMFHDMRKEFAVKSLLIIFAAVNPAAQQVASGNNPVFTNPAERGIIDQNAK